MAAVWFYSSKAPRQDRVPQEVPRPEVPESVLRLISEVLHRALTGLVRQVNTNDLLITSDNKT